MPKLPNGGFEVDESSLDKPIIKGKPDEPKKEPVEKT